MRSCDTKTIVPSKSLSPSTSISVGGEVQVIGRLVEYQKVRRTVEHPRDREPRFLTAGERPNRFVHIVSRELERAGEQTQRADAIVGKVVFEAVR